MDVSDVKVYSNGLESGVPVKVMDGRIGILQAFKLYEYGPYSPGRAAVQFYDPKTHAFHVEGFSILDVSHICPSCHGTGRVIESE